MNRPEFGSPDFWSGYGPQFEPPQYGLQKYQRNDIFRAIESSGVPVTDFELSVFIDRDPYAVRGSPPVEYQITVIRHRAIGAVLGIKPCWEREFEIRIDVCGARSIEGLFDGDPNFQARTFKWDDVPAQVQNWAREVGDATPDLWDALYRARDYADPERNFENTPFPAGHEEDFKNTRLTRAEQAQISDLIRQIKQYVEYTYDLSSEQRSRVEDALDQAEKASHRLDWKDWKILFYGTVASLIAQNLIPPQAEQYIIRLVINGLGHLFGLGGPPHLPPG